MTQLPQVDFAFSKRIELQNKTNLFFFDNCQDLESNHSHLIIFVHGWPTPSYVWRHQIQALNKVGRFRIVAPDLRGYGYTFNPDFKDKSDYAHQGVIEDLRLLIPMLGFKEAILIGHDWGGSLVWCAAMLFPEFSAVCGITTPYYPPHPKYNPQDTFIQAEKEPSKSYGKFDYQVYFQKEGIAEKELNQDIEKTFKCIASAKTNPKETKIKLNQAVDSSNVRERGGMLVGFPDNSEIPRSFMHSEKDLEYYVQSFKQQGGFGPSLNWYRNYETNWKWRLSMDEHKKVLKKPSLLIILGGDDLFPKSASDHMAKWIPDLKRQAIPNVSHWVQEEEPEQLNQMLGDWLKEIVPANSNL